MFEQIPWSDVYNLWKQICYNFPNSLNSRFASYYPFRS